MAMVTRRLNPKGVSHTAVMLFLCALFPLMSAPPVSLAEVGTTITPSALPSCSGPCGVGVTIVTPPLLGTTVTTITGGARPANGPNLFHSFGRFDVGTGDIANFFNETGRPTSNILSRVTGGNPSQIYGTIQTTDFPGANLFLMNPAGVLFGATAVLDLGAVTGSAVRQPGSFYATTADYLKLVDAAGSSHFYADPAQASVLSVAPVAAFGFTASNPVSITLEGGSLVVGQGKTLSFIGGNAPFLKTVSEAPLVEEPVPSGVTVTGGSLSAPGGHIQLASIASAQDASPTEVSIADLSVTIVNPSVNQVAVLGHIALTGTALDVSGQFEVDAFGNQIGGNSGTVRMIGKSLLMDQASVTATTVGPADGNSPAVDLRITEDATLTNQSSLSTSTTGPGRGGDVIVTAEALTLKGDSRIFTGNDSFGRGGDLQLYVDTLTLAEGATLRSANNDFSGTTDAEGNVTLGVGGDITIQGVTGPGSYATDVTITGRGSFDSPSEIATNNNISAFAVGFAGGKGGRVTIASQSITLNDGLITSLATGFIGPGGDIDLGLRQLTISNGGQITSQTGSFDPGSPGGEITIHELAEGLVPSVTLSGSGINGASGIFSVSSGNANPGNISITTGTLSLTDGAVLKNGDPVLGPQGASITIHASDSVQVTTGSSISSQASSQPAGPLVITTPTLSMNQGLINTSTFGFGKAGDVTLNVRALTLENGSRVESGTVGSGSAGSITVQGFDGTAGSRVDSVTIRGQGGLFTETGKVGTLEIPDAEGAGGNIKVVTNTFTLEDGAIISAASSSIGDGGSITIDASGSFTSNASTVSTSAENARGGNIDVTAQSVALSNGTVISASSKSPLLPEGGGNAGNITITSDSNVVIMQNSSVTTEASHASGGSIEIDASDAGMIQLVNSRVSTSVGGSVGVPDASDGGNITIDPQFVILQNSQIIAQANAGAGGAINVTTGVFLADPTSVVDASSQQGPQGTVNIQSPVQNVGGRLTPLSQQFSSAAALLAQRCAARVADGKFSTFVVAGREGLPVEPGGFLASPSLTAELLGTSLSGRYRHSPIAAVTGSFPEYDARPIQLAKFADACRQ
jgi:filamentous hemagglutinin family protein